jgi:hypothetical protein
MAQEASYMTSAAGMTLSVRLAPPSLDFWVDVRLRQFGDRWIAAADIAGSHEIGLGSSARQALVASLSPLGPRARGLLMADTALLAPSMTLAGS